MNRGLVFGSTMAMLLAYGCGKQAEPLPTRPPLVTCPGGVLGDTTRAATIRFTDLKIGDRQIRGTADNVNTDAVRVVLWTFSDRWRIQPSRDSMATICSDKTWESHVGPWSRLVAMLVGQAYSPADSVSMTPPMEAPGVLEWTSYPSRDLGPALVFDNRVWRIRTGTETVDGRPVRWSADVANVFVDGLGLHLRLGEPSGAGTSAGVLSVESLGLGAYTVQVSSPVWNLDSSTCIRMGCLEPPRPKFAVEFAGETILRGIENARFVGYLRNATGDSLSVHAFMLPASISSSWQVDWRSYQLGFLGWWGLDPYSPSRAIDGHEIYFVNGGKSIDPEGDLFSFNITGQANRNPAKASEVVIRSFTYHP